MAIRFGPARPRSCSLRHRESSPPRGGCARPRLLPSPGCFASSERSWRQVLRGPGAPHRHERPGRDGHARPPPRRDLDRGSRRVLLSAQSLNVGSSACVEARLACDPLVTPSSWKQIYEAQEEVEENLSSPSSARQVWSLVIRWCSGLKRSRLPGVAQDGLKRVAGPGCFPGRPEEKVVPGLLASGVEAPRS